MQHTIYSQKSFCTQTLSLHVFETYVLVFESSHHCLQILPLRQLIHLRPSSSTSNRIGGLLIAGRKSHGSPYYDLYTTWSLDTPRDFMALVQLCRSRRKIESSLTGLISQLQWNSQPISSCTVFGNRWLEACKRTDSETNRRGGTIAPGNNSPGILVHSFQSFASLVYV